MAPKYDIGLIGLGVMGANFALNVADHGFSIACYDKDASKVKNIQELNRPEIYAAETLEEFLAVLKLPRCVMLLIPAGLPVDKVLVEVVPFLQKGDCVLDGGNSYYKDTTVRAKHLSEQGIYFLGMGISGGEEGARKGPSLMPGGQRDAYERIAPILEAVAAKVDGVPCVSYLGPGSAGHFVKMVHNGIEYALMQLISETYDVMKRFLSFDDDALSEIYAEWNQGELAGYLLEITSNIFKKQDDKTGKRLVDQILGVAEQKGTGMWTTQSAMELQVPSPTIDVAVGMRDLSMQEEIRHQGSQMLSHTLRSYKGDKQKFLELLRNSFYVGMAAAFAQGFAILKRASERLAFDLKLETVATLWRGGCIIRAAFLEEIRKAYQTQNHLPHLLLDPEISRKILAKEESLRRFLAAAIEAGVPVPGFLSVLGYLDSLRSEWLPDNLIQAQRDYFGAHTYERKDEKGTFHTNWTPQLESAVSREFASRH